MSALTMLTVNCDAEAKSPAGRDDGVLDPDPRVAKGPACVLWVQFDHETPTEARRWLKEQGWIRVKVEDEMLDLCSACAARYRQWKAEQGS